MSDPGSIFVPVPSLESPAYLVAVSSFAAILIAVGFVAGSMFVSSPIGVFHHVPTGYGSGRGGPPRLMLAWRRWGTSHPEAKCAWRTTDLPVNIPLHWCRSEYRVRQSAGRDRNCSRQSRSRIRSSVPLRVSTCGPKSRDGKYGQSPVAVTRPILLRICDSDCLIPLSPPR